MQGRFNYFLCAVLFLSTTAQAAIATKPQIVQECFSDNCTQVGVNQGTINIEDVVLQIAVNNGVVNVYGKPEDKQRIANYEVKVGNLRSQIQNHIRKVEELKNQTLGDKQKLPKRKTNTR